MTLSLCVKRSTSNSTSSSSLKLVYLLIALLYAAVTANFYLSYTLSQRCLDFQFICPSSSASSPSSSSFSPSSPSSSSSFAPSLSSSSPAASSSSPSSSSSSSHSSSKVSTSSSSTSSVPSFVSPVDLPHPLAIDSSDLLGQVTPHIPSVIRHKRSQVTQSSHRHFPCIVTANNSSTHRRQSHLHRNRRHHISSKSHTVNSRQALPSASVVTSGDDDNSDGQSVEFFAKPQPTQESSSHVWLNSYSRIPLVALQEYCRSSARTFEQYCPPGNPGPKGDKGDQGTPGPRGTSGPVGPLGPPGLKGNKGENGEAGLDGREGLPGEPGLDGVPGRDGKDGIDGIPGTPGLAGRDGKPGTNGTDGIPGLRGPPGPPGSPGLAGPRGRKGKDGQPGKPGGPVAPRMNEKESQVTVTVQEGDNVRLPCIADGQPPPKYSWRRTDKKAIRIGQWSNSLVEGPVLNITRVRREHFSSYICFANNGVPPPASYQVNLEVSFSPTIKTRQQMVGTNNGSSVVLECQVEAYPPALIYWVQGESRMIESNWKYKVMQQDSEPYTNYITLNITYVEPSDYGLFKCVAKNERGKTFGLLTLYEIDPNRPKPTGPVATGGADGEEGEFVVFGQSSLPPFEPCPPCPDCPVIPRCPRGYNLYDSVRAIPVTGAHHNRSAFVPMKDRQKHCVLNQIGKPVYYRDAESEWGSWMQDSAPKTGEDESKFWLTMDAEPSLLQEFGSKDAFRHKRVTKNHQLPFKLDGNSHVVHDGHFYYNQFGTNKLIKYELATNHTYFRHIEEASHRPYTAKLYETQYNYMDIMADENGLWVVFATNGTNNTLVLKFDPVTLGTENVWNITLDHTMIGEMFIACGVLYGIESATETFTKIRFAFDLYLNSPVDISVNFTNPFKHNNLIAYNPRHEKIYAWDSKNLIEYPLKFTESTSESEEESEEQTSNKDNSTRGSSR